MTLQSLFFSTRGQFLAGAVVLFLLTLVGVNAAYSCPFCPATGQTFSEEIGNMDGALFAKLVKAAPPAPKTAEQTDIPKATFEVYKVLKGGFIKPGDKIESLYFGEDPVGTPFLITGVDPKRPMWSTPLKITDRFETYLDEVMKLPKEGPDRVKFFLNYLEDKDNLLGRDAYDEFAKAPYSVIKQLKPELKHEVIMGWLKDPEIPVSHRRLYLVMLGVCGSEADLPYLEEIIRSTDRKQKMGLDSLIACYLTLKGESGLALIEDLYLKNKKADYAETYSTIMALRFHVTDGEVIPKQKLVEGFRLMLSRSELADLVIPDLARFEDWDSTDTLMELYRNASESNSWVRVPVINFLRASPRPEAKRLLAECEKIDPASMKRANAYFPKPAETAPASPDKASQIPAEPATSVVNAGAELTDGQDVPPVDAAVVAASATLPVSTASEEPSTDELPPTPIASEETYGKLAAPTLLAQSPPAEPTASDVRTASREDIGNKIIASVNKGAPPVAALRRSKGPNISVYYIVGIPWLVGIILFGLQWSILRGIGSGRRS